MSFESIKAFMNEIIDYAGIFPPASLPFKESFENYLDYRTFKNKWMLNKFVCPFSRLDELSELINENPFINESNPLHITVLGSLSQNALHFEKSFPKDINDMSKFLKSNRSIVSIDAYEVKLPLDLVNFRESADFLDTLDLIQRDITKNISPHGQIFYEIDLKNNNWIDNVDSIIAGLSVCNQFYIEEDKSPRIGFKLRTGGITPDMIPLSIQVAYVIKKCIDNKVPFKATAGLHTAVKHFDENLKTKMYGFLNVFSAGIIYYYYQMSLEDLTLIVDNENMSDFIFEENSFSYKDLKVSIDEIKYVRDTYMLSMGSCSYDEPLQELRELKLL
jgi:hypothetical protein